MMANDYVNVEERNFDAVDPYANNYVNEVEQQQYEQDNFIAQEEVYQEEAEIVDDYAMNNMINQEEMAVDADI